MRAGGRTSRAASLAIALAALATSCAVLPPPPSGRTVTCVTRTLADGLHLRILEHRMRVVEPSLVAFLDAHPELDGRLTLPDLLFLERLAESGRRDAFRGAGSGAADGADTSSGEPADRLDAVARIKVGLVREALRFPEFPEAINGALRDDSLDSSSEHGGLVILERGEGCPLSLIPIPSTSAGDDHGYGLPTELFTAACLAFWHDHAGSEGDAAAEEAAGARLPGPSGAVGPPGADRSGNPRPPGPSGAVGPSLVTAWGDRWIAYLRGIDGLVFTPVDGGGFSIVFFSSEGESVDLGRFASP